MKLIIGTAQFGLNYGVATIYKQNTIEDSRAILEVAQNNDINYIDTAVVYGNSEEVVGKIAGDRFNIITKTSNNLSVIGADKIIPNLKQSLSKLNIKQAFGLLIHNADDILDETQDVFSQLSKAKTDGLVKNIGVSVYNPEQAHAVLNKYDIDIMQVPCNILDQRFIHSGVIELLKTRNIKIYARSIFLQGVLLKQIDVLPSYLDKIKAHIIKLQNCAKEANISMLSLLLSYISSIKEIDKIVVGIHKSFQLNEVIDTYKQLTNHNIDFSQFSVSDLSIIDPRRWNK